MSQLDKGNAFQALHQRPGIFVIPNPWDAGTARLLARLGFEALATTSSGFAHTLGRADGDVTRDEAIAGAQAIAQATPLPVSGDLENGYGDDPETVAETIRQAAAAGLVGGSIEDATNSPDQPIYPFAQAVERVQAAVAAARALPFPFTLTARAENFLHGRQDLDDTIARLQAFEAAGADVLYAPGLRTIADVAKLCAALTKPVNALATPNFTVKELGDAGVKRVSLGGAFARAALDGLLEAATAVRDEGSFRFIEGLQPWSQL